MKKLMDKLFNNIKFDKKYVFFSMVIAIIGIITGSVFIVVLNSTDKSLVTEYISSFMDNIKNNNILVNDIVRNVFINNFLVILIIYIIGFTFFLFPINILILFYKSFIIGFSLASIILTYNIKGILISLTYIFPHLIINILLFSLLTAFTLKLSIKMINYIINKKEVNMRAYFNKYMYILMLSIIIICITSLYESFIVTYLLKLIGKII